MAQTLVKTIADFNTTLASKVAVGATTATLTSATDDDGVALPTGTYVLTIDRKNSSKEYIECTLTGTALTNIKTVARGTGVATAGFARTHRKGAEVIISDFAVIKRLTNLLDGTTDLDSGTPLKYDGTASISNSNHLATKAYVDGVAIAGAPDASTTVKGISKLSTAPASPTEPIAVGTNDTRVPTQDENDALVGTSGTPSSSNKFVTDADDRVEFSVTQTGSQVYAADAGSNDTYAVTLSPVPASYTTGMVVRFKANTANTGAATLNVNSLGAKTIKKNYNSDLATGDIVANQIVEVIYDGTNFQMQSATSGLLQSFASGVEDGPGGTTQNIAHGLGVTPKFIKITCSWKSNSGAEQYFTYGTYNGTTNYGIGFAVNTAATIKSSSNVVNFTNGGGTSFTASAAFDSTNITLSWNSAPSTAATILWEAFA